MIKITSKGNKVKLSQHFNSTEFDCKGAGCCSSTRISSELVDLLEKVRTHFRKPLVINCGFRCYVHNAAVGGASNSKHLTGYAADIKISGIDPIVLAFYIDSLIPKTGGIEVGSYDAGTSGYVHVDVRESKWRAYRPLGSNTKYNSYDSMYPQIRAGVRGAAVTIFSRKLKKMGYIKSVKDNCDGELISAIRAFQSANGLVADGIAGEKTWKKLSTKL